MCRTRTATVRAVTTRRPVSQKGKGVIVWLGGQIKTVPIVGCLKKIKRRSTPHRQYAGYVGGPLISS